MITKTQKQFCWILKLGSLLVLAGVVSLAQMGGGMGSGMMGPGNQSNENDMMGPGSGSQMGMGAGMGMVNGMNGMDGPVIGPDGTAYVVRRTLVTQNQQAGTPAWNAELAAISVRDGTPKWKLEIPGFMISEPALGKDGKIFLTAGENWMSQQTIDSARKAKFIVVTSDLVSARITAQVEVDSDVLTTPRIATDETGSYVVYVEGYEMSSMHSNDQDSAVAGEKTLYAFRPDGTLKFKVKLSEAQVGMTPR